MHTARDRITGEVCPCGCGSKRAVAISTRRHVDVILDVWKGVRSVRALLPEDKHERFDELAESGAYERIYMPLRCSVIQEEVALDTRTQVILINGGQRAGKTTVALAWLVDRILVWGGPGASFLWVAPTREMFWVGMTKMCFGEATDRQAKPAIDPRLVLSRPGKLTDQEQNVQLVDGTRIIFRHAGDNGDNLRAFSVRGAVFDEATAKGVGERNMDVLLGRVSDSGGQILMPTTPQLPHWVKERVYDRCVTYEDAYAMEKAGEGWPLMIQHKLTAYNNPFEDPAIVDNLVEVAGGANHPSVRREWFGEWISDGNRLWPAFVNGTPYVVDFDGRDLESFGWVNITNKIATEFGGPFYASTWATSKGKRDCSFVLGLDYNFGGLPPSAAVIKVLCHRTLDMRNPNNWVLYVEDEYVTQQPDEWAFFRSLANDAVRVWNQDGASLPLDYLAGSHCVGDATGFQEARRNRSQGNCVADAGIKTGFDIVPPQYSMQGEPENPKREARFSFMRGLMRKRDGAPPQFMVNARCRQAIHSLENEVDEGGRGANAKKAGSLADRMSGITDAVGYAAWALMQRHLEVYNERLNKDHG